MIDLHCHLDLYPDPATVIARTDAAGIYVLSVTTTPKAWVGTKQLAQGCKRIRTALGLHPQVAHERAHELSLFERLISEVEYVGEIGLDGSKNYAPYFEEQQRIFSKILSIVSDAGGRIMSIHSKQAATEVLHELEKHPKAGPAILHWFSGTKEELKRAINMGCWFSVGPAMLKSSKGTELAMLMPSNKILLETDGPFAQSEGKPYEPCDAYKAVKTLAQLWNEEEKVTEAKILSNFKALISFNIK